jgi:hypothetical protein
MSESQKSFVDEENTTLIVCPECDVSRRISVAQFKGTNHIIKAKCPCGEQFTVNLNFRYGHRKDTLLRGSYRGVSEHKAYEKECQIVNLSLTGLSAKVFEDFDFKINDELRVEFTLNNQKQTQIERKIRIRYIGKNTFGGEFFDHQLDNFGKIIKFYLID